MGRNRADIWAKWLKSSKEEWRGFRCVASARKRSSGGGFNAELRVVVEVEALCPAEEEKESARWSQRPL